MEPLVKRLPSPAEWRRRVRIAWIVALVADAVQLLAIPLFIPGAASPFDSALEVVVSIALFRLLGWHPALLPALLGELIPGVDLVPSWTIAVFIVTRGRPALRQPDDPPAG
ncbi:MAG: hypothetical protein ABIU54_03600 [Candidatus Eisenbacteria bacterium]